MTSRLTLPTINFRETLQVAKAIVRPDMTRAQHVDPLPSRSDKAAGPAAPRQRNLAALAAPPQYHREGEKGVVNKTLLDLADTSVNRNEQGKIPLATVLDPKQAYLVVAAMPNAESDALGTSVRLAVETEDNGVKMGHPTMFRKGEAKFAPAAGEISHLRGNEWLIDGHTGRYLIHTKKERAAAGFRKSELLTVMAKEISRQSDLRVTEGVVLSDNYLLREFQARTGIGGKRFKIDLDDDPST